MVPLTRLAQSFGMSVKKINQFSFFDFDSLVLSRLISQDSFRFIQIGANDGVMNDSLYPLISRFRKKTEGLVVEPVFDYFLALEKNYQTFPSVSALRLAIHPTLSEVVLHRVDPNLEPSLPKQARGIASTDPSHWSKSGFIESSSSIVTETCQAQSLSAVISNSGFDSLDLLLTDTEGMDFEILMDLDLTVHKPSIIHFEHGLRDNVMSTQQYSSLQRRLNENGYQLFLGPYDSTAVLVNLGAHSNG